MARIVEYEDGGRERFADAALDSGAKGQVFLSESGDHVLKIFIAGDGRTLETPFSAPTHYHELKQVVGRFNVVQHHPYWSELFAWPDKIATHMNGAPCLGVRMRRVDLPAVQAPLELFLGHYDTLTPQKRGWWIARVAIAMKLARAVNYLETGGVEALAHTDLSPRNLRADPYTGEAILIDCDGIVAPGLLTAQVAGTRPYMAPELESGAEPFPTRYSDRHALAVLIYRLLLYRHPLKGPQRHPNVATGAISAEDEERYLWGQGALYIADPQRTENRPRSPVISTTSLGSVMHRHFLDAFVLGLHQPGLRPEAWKWEDALTRLFDRVVPCGNPRCPQRFFAMPDRPSPPDAIACPACNTPLHGPAYVPYLELQRLATTSATAIGQIVDDNRYVVVGWPGRSLFKWHLATDIAPKPPYDPNPVGRIEYDNTSGKWYLSNLRVPEMQVWGAAEKTPPGSHTELLDGMQIFLGASVRSRLARVRMVPLPGSGPVYSLPAMVEAQDKPWPTLTPQRADVQWQRGQPITLRANPGVTLTPAEQQARAEQERARAIQALAIRNQQRRRLLIARISAIGFAAAIAALMVGGGIQVVAYWFASGHRLVLMSVVVAAVASLLFGLKRAVWVWLIIAVVVVGQGALAALSHPLQTVIGGGVGLVIGAIIALRMRA